MTRAVELAQVAALGVSEAFKNRIINGAMVIDQRNAGAAVTINSSPNAFILDRWFANGESADGVFTGQQVTTAPDGFNNSLKFTVTTADASIGATQGYTFRQRVEGFNMSDFGWGTANAKTVTLSFWVQSSLTGTFGGSLFNINGDRVYVFGFTISAANTWEQKSITIVGDTTGTWNTTNGTGLNISFSLGVGSSNKGPVGSWGSTFYFAPTGSVDLIATNGATFFLTGVQLEVGSTATSFDYRPYTTEFMLCQRYYYKYVGASGNNYEMIGTGVATNATQADVGCPLPVPMRTVPSCAFTGTIFGYDQGTAQILSSIGAIYGGKSNIYLNLIFTNSGGFSAGRGFIFYTQNASTASFAFSAEL